jgi:hypothetical protein
MIRLELFNRDQRIYNNLIVNKLIILDSILDLDNSVLTNEYCFTEIDFKFCGVLTWLASAESTDTSNK